MRIVVDVVPDVAVPPPVTVRSMVFDPAEVNAKVASRLLKGPAGLVEPEGTHAKVADVSGSVPWKVNAFPASASQWPLN
jgi:hypothetical protein